MHDLDSEADPLAPLAEEFAERYRRGERPALTEYTEKYPELAERIRNLFPALVEMERLGSVGGRVARNFTVGSPGRGHVPQQLGEYRIIREVARGGMGIVYEAVQESLGRHVALKVLPMVGPMSPTQLERFRREARAAARLHHTNIVPVFGVGEHEGIHYFAMQLIRGQGLDRVLDELVRLRGTAAPPAASTVRRVDLSTGIARGLLSDRFPDGERPPDDSPGFTAGPTEDWAHPAEGTPEGTGSIVLGDPSGLGNQSSLAYSRSVARVGVQVAEALAYSHQQGILHRDIKPANLLLDTQGTVWVSDFGLVKEQGSEELTTQGDVVGTLRYMAPERFLGRSDPRSDVYSLGLTLYEMLTLRPAFAAGDRARFLERVQTEEPPRPRTVDPYIPRDLETIVLKAIAKDPARRYASATAMAEDLRRFLADRPVKARRAATWERIWRWVRRNPGLAVSTAAAALFLVVIAASSVGWTTRLRSELRRTTRAQRAEGDAKKDALDKLWRSHLAQARAGRFSRRPGQRLDSLAALAEAVLIARKVGATTEAMDELRNEVIASLALPDMRPGTRSAPTPPGTSAIIFDWTYRRYALSNAEGAISVFNLGDDRPIARLPGLGQAPEVLLISPDGKFVSDFCRGEVQAWDVDGGRSVFPEPLPVRSASQFSRDSRLVVAVKPDGSIGFWDLRTAREIRCLRTGIAPDMFALHPDDRKLAVGYRQHSAVVQVWDTDSGKKLTELPAGGAGNVNALAWHPDGHQLALSIEGRTGRVEIWDTAEQRTLVTLEGHSEGVVGMTFHPRGDLLVTGSFDGTTRMWDTKTGRPLVIWPSGLGNVQFSGDGAVCGFAAVGGQARLMEVADGREYRTLVSKLGAGRGEYRQGDISADGLLAVGMDDGTRLWDLSTGLEVAFLPDRRTDSVNFVSRPDGRELLTCSSSGLRRWPIRENPETPKSLSIGPPRIVDLPFVPIRAHAGQDGRAVAVASERSGIALVIDLPTEVVRCTLSPHPSLIRAMLSPDGRWAATSGWHSPSVKVWNARTGAMVKELPLGTMNNACFSPDGQMLLTSHGSGYCAWQVPSWLPAKRLPLEIVSYPGWVAFSPDQTLLAMELAPAVIHLVSTATGRTLAKLEDPRSDRAQWLGFTPDGSRLVAIATYSREIHVWDLSAIRQYLAAMELDWESPPCSPSPEALARRSLTVEALLGATPTREQAADDRARRDIETFRLAVESQPESAMAHNDLAWVYATAPDHLRDTNQALALAETATRLSPHDRLIRNTLGVAYYRVGRYREAADTLRGNLATQKAKYLAADLYFLAMSHYRLGEEALARAYYTWANRVAASQAELTAEEVQEQGLFRAEAELLMGK
jgi:eukaryotic-like serine/threonine-protein kinase